MSDLINRDKKVIWHPFSPLKNSPDPIPVIKGEGVYLITEDGNKYIDGISSWWVNIHGHSNKILAKAIADQAHQLEHVIFANFTHEPAVKLAENVLSILPDNQSRVFFSDDGSTAVEVGLKMAFQFWYNKGMPRTKVIAFEGAYHGDTFGSMAVGDRNTFTAPFSKFLFDVAFIPFPDTENREDVIKQFKAIIESGDVASFIFEPLLQGSAGMRTYAPELLNELIAIAHEDEVICIADEVFTGFGRTGKMFATDYINNKPDIYCLSKGLTGGTLALSLTVAAQRIVECFESADIMKTFFHGHSYTANPVACAAANASFEILMSQETQDNIQRISNAHAGFKKWLDDQQSVRNPRHLGTLLAFELATKKDTGYFNEIRTKVTPFFLEKGIFLRPLGNVIYILPPYVITNDELKKIYKAIKDFLEVHHQVLQ